MAHHEEDQRPWFDSLPSPVVELMMRAAMLISRAGSFVERLARSVRIVSGHAGETLSEALERRDEEGFQAAVLRGEI